jgi:hypothetical protein
MSKKYIAQNNVSNFVYPNNTLTQYDVEIIHDLKEDTVTGTVSNFTMTNSGSNLIVSFNYTWNLNTAEPFINNIGQISLLSLHMMTPDKLYFKPWINVGYVSDANTSLTTKSGTASFTITPAMAGTSSFNSGDYFYEVRFIGHRSIYAVPMQSTEIAATPTPTPTPTPSATPGYIPSTPTPTPTPSSTPSGGSLFSIGSAPVVGSTSCGIIGSTPPLYLDGSDFSIFSSNGGCMSGVYGTVNYIRDAVGNPISGTFYFVWYGGSCSLTTYKSTVGHLTLNPTQC